MTKTNVWLFAKKDRKEKGNFLFYRTILFKEMFVKISNINTDLICSMGIELEIAGSITMIKHSTIQR